MTKTRDTRIDILKGICILLVVIGHNIQMLKGNQYANGAFYDNPLFAVIYTFYMPLFMLISGYLFHGSLNKYSTKTLVAKKIESLIVPIITWTLIEMFFFGGKELDFISITLTILTSIWFLWAVFFSSMGVISGNKIFNDSLVFHIIVMIILLLLPDTLNKSLYGFMYPYFVTGYFVKKNNINISKINVWSVAILFVILLFFWSEDKYIYTTGLTLIGKHNIIEMLIIDFYRWAIGFLGSFIIIRAVDYIYHKSTKGYPLLANLGIHSLGIYILSTYMSNHLFPLVSFFEEWDEGIYTLACIGLSVVVISLCLIIINLIKKSNTLSAFLLGNGFKNKRNENRHTLNV